MTNPSNDRVLSLIDEELHRFRYLCEPLSAEKLQAVRDAYVADSLAREAACLRLYDDA